LKPEPLEEEEEKSFRQQSNLNQGVFQMSLDFRKNIPNVIYFQLIDYLLQTLELKLEFSHIILISNFISELGQILNANLTYMH